MIYLDNAATGGFKPISVMETAVNVIRYLSANPGRSGHRLSKTGAEFIYSCRKKLSNFFNNGNVERVVFTKNCTEALNMAILGLDLHKTKVITTVFEHNSVLRPLFSLRDKGLIELTIIEPSNNEYITVDDVSKAYSNDVSLVCINHASNVTGAINDIYKIGDFLREKPAVFLVDGAQSAGHVKINMAKCGIDILCLAGHKGLYSILGSGALVFNDKVNLNAIYKGGTGTESFNPDQPDCYPERLECGTLNLPSICALEEGVRYVENNLDYISEVMLRYTEYVIDKLKTIDGVTVFSKKNEVGIVSFKLDKLSSDEVADILSSKYDVAVRGGFHCAPLIHKFLKTENEGLVRISLSPHNTKRELNALLNAIKEITSF